MQARGQGQVKQASRLNSEVKSLNLILTFVPHLFTFPAKILNTEY